MILLQAQVFLSGASHQPLAIRVPLLAIGVIAIGWAFWYRARKNKK